MGGRFNIPELFMVGGGQPVMHGWSHNSSKVSGERSPRTKTLSPLLKKTKFALNVSRLDFINRSCEVSGILEITEPWFRAQYLPMSHAVLTHA